MIFESFHLFDYIWHHERASRSPDFQECSKHDKHTSVQQNSKPTSSKGQRNRKYNSQSHGSSLKSRIIGKSGGAAAFFAINVKRALNPEDDF